MNHYGSHVPFLRAAMSDPSTSAMLHGPGGLLSTPGLGSRRKRKWGTRLKDKQIKGNLYRSDVGRFTAGNGPPSVATAKKPRAARKPRLTDAERQQARDDKKRATGIARATERATNRQKILEGMNIAPDGQAALGDLADGQQPRDPSAIERGGFVEAGLVERANDGSYRMTASGRAALAAAASGDAGRAGDTISSARDRLSTRAGKQQAATARREAVAARRVEAAKKKPAKASAGGSKQPEKPATAHAATPKPKRATRQSAPSVGSVGGGSSPKPKPVAPKAPAAAKPTISPALRDAASAVSTGDNVTDVQLQQLVTNGLVRLNKDGEPILTAAGQRATMKSFTVYKDHTGASRWIARTTTAYRDRDNEILSEAALDSDSLRMTATKQFGPLRYWHVGSPDPFDETNPAGPGLDIGDCDYSVVIGRTRIESGTFRNAGIAQKMAAAADRHEMSPGFFHPLDQPDAGGVFDTIRTFERSTVPTRYGRGSNLFTGFTVKEFSMEISEMERRFKAMYSELGLTPEQGMEVGQQLVATEKTAQAQGIAFKDSGLSPIDLIINGAVYAIKDDQSARIPGDITVNDVHYALKAFPPKADDTAAPIEEVKADAPPVVDETVVDEPPMEDAQPEGDYIGDMSWDEFSAKLTELLAPVLKMQDMVKSMGDAHAELKTMYGGVATKDAGTLAEIASLKARLSEIEGDQPATILPDDVAEALKSAGPAKPDEPERKQIVSTPERPWAGWGAKTFPELYQNGENA